MYYHDNLMHEAAVSANPIHPSSVTKDIAIPPFKTTLDVCPMLGHSLTYVQFKKTHKSSRVS